MAFQRYHGQSIKLSCSLWQAWIISCCSISRSTPSIEKRYSNSYCKAHRPKNSIVSLPFSFSGEAHSGHLSGILSHPSHETMSYKTFWQSFIRHFGWIIRIGLISSRWYKDLTFLGPLEDEQSIRISRMRSTSS